MTSRFTQKAQNTLNNALRIAEELGHTYVGSEHLLLSLAEESDSVSSRILNDAGISPHELKAKLSELSGHGIPTRLSSSDMTPKLRQIIESCGGSEKKSSEHIGTEDILQALINERDCVALKLLESCGVSPADIRSELSAYLSSRGERVRETAKPEKNSNPAIAGAPTLSLYAKDLTAAAALGKLDVITGRDSECAHIIRILSRRTKNNPCLIGEAGVGKTAIIEGLAQMINHGAVPEELRTKRIVTLDISSMLAGAKYRGEFEERMKNVMQEIRKDPNLILFIDEFHTIVGAGAAEGAVDAANIIKPALARGEIRIIGATTLSEYRAYIEKDPALERRFQPILVNEPSEAETVRIIKALRPRYEEHHSLTISDEAIDAAVKLSVRYIPDRFLPDKAIDIIDEAASKRRLEGFTLPDELKAAERELSDVTKKKEEAVLSERFQLAERLRSKELELRERVSSLNERYEISKQNKDLSVTADDVADIVTAWTGIPISRIVEEESERLSRLEDELNRRVIGQREAISAVARAIKRGRAGLKDPKRPIGSFIFLGKTGVGKTELSRALSELMFGSSDSMIRLDMAEYMEKHSVSKLIGSPPGYVGYGEGGQLTEKIRRRPYSLLLLDEIEKAHPDVFNLLLSVLEDGVLTDSAGRRVDFKNTIIIMTSNTGAVYRERASLGFSSQDERGRADAYRANILSELKKQFSPEFLNRIDDVIVFNQLSREDIAEIAREMLNELKTRADTLDIELTFDDSLPEHLAISAYDEAFGARSVRRAIVHGIEDKLSSMIVEGDVHRGDRVKISLIDNEIRCVV